MRTARSTGPRDSPVQTVAKAAEALDYLAANGELTASELTELLSEPRSSVYRLLASLSTAELVEAGNRRGTFRLGLKLFQLGTRVAQRFDERQLALPVMERLHELTEETVFLCVRRGRRRGLHRVPARQTRAGAGARTRGIAAPARRRSPEGPACVRAEGRAGRLPAPGGSRLLHRPHAVDAVGGQARPQRGASKGLRRERRGRDHRHRRARRSDLRPHRPDPCGALHQRRAADDRRTSTSTSCAS